jgi:hypothetical protein
VKTPERFRWTALLFSAALAASAALAVAACSGAKHTPGGAPARSDGGGQDSGDPVTALVPVKKQLGIVAARGFSIGPIAATKRHLFWEAARGEEGGEIFLLGRDLETGTTRVLADGVSQAFGIATTPDTLLFAARGSAGTELTATDLRGGHRRVLSRSLLAPFDARGDVVAWAEPNGSRQRVVVRNMRSGRQSVAMDAPRCRRARCYRIDRVTVAREGVAFDLGSIGQGYPSLIARRRWSDTKTSFISVPDDPQPDLVRSAAGALFYQLQRGWVEWNFDEDRPRVTSVRGARPWMLAAQGGRRLVVTGSTCKTGVGVLRADGRVAALPAPSSTPASPTRFGALCRQLTGIAWTGNRLLLAWAFTPKISLEGHSAAGLSAIITAARVH